MFNRATQQGQIYYNPNSIPQYYPVTVPDQTYLYPGYGYQQPTYFGSPSSTTTGSPSSSSSAAFSPLISPLTPELPKTSKAARRSSHARRPSVSFAEPEALRDFIDNGSEERPAYSVKTLCEVAIKGSKKGRLTLSEICEIIQERFPYYRSADNAKRLRYVVTF